MLTFSFSQTCGEALTTSAGRVYNYEALTMPLEVDTYFNEQAYVFTLDFCGTIACVGSHLPAGTKVSGRTLECFGDEFCLRLV